MKIIPSDVRYARVCAVCGATHTRANPVAFEVWFDEIDESARESAKLPIGEFARFHMCLNCMEKYWEEF